MRPLPDVPALRPTQVAGIAVAWCIGLAVIAIFGHPTPLYFVETDLVGHVLPSARELLQGRLDPARIAIGGPGYPLLVALFALPLGGDVLVAAKLLGLLAAACAAVLAWRIARRAAGETAASIAFVGMLAMPALLRSALEPGADLPVLALLLASTALVLEGSGPRRAFFAGAVAGCAILTRGDAIFLVPCALVVFALEARRGRRIGAYLAGLALPFVAWGLAVLRAGGLPPDRGYMSIAWELYGQDARWDVFESTIGREFHSLFDVLAFDPGAASTRVVTNVFVHRVLDARELVPAAVATLALAGLLRLGSRPAAYPWLAHVATCALVLAFVTYDARLALYLLPLYVVAAATTLAWAWSLATGPEALRLAGTVRVALMLVGLVLLADGVATAVREARVRFAGAPHETRLAGRALARLRPGGDGAVMARMPHVAYFAGRAFMPLPADVPLFALPEIARRAGADFVFYSPIEFADRPQFGVLSDSGVVLPGLEPIAWQRIEDDRQYAIYRIAATIDTTGFALAWGNALARFESRHPGDVAVARSIAAQRLDLGDPAEALACLDRAKERGASDARLERLRSIALTALGRFEAAEDACLQSMDLAPATAWHWGQLGDLATTAGRFDQAAAWYAKASEREPTNTHYLERLGKSYIADGEAVRAADAFERALDLEPDKVMLRRLAMGAWQLAGNETRMRELYEDGVARGATPSDLLGRDVPPPPLPGYAQPAGVY